MIFYENQQKGAQLNKRSESWPILNQPVESEKQNQVKTLACVQLTLCSASSVVFTTFDQHLISCIYIKQVNCYNIRKTKLKKASTLFCCESTHERNFINLETPSSNVFMCIYMHLHVHVLCVCMSRLAFVGRDSHMITDFIIQLLVFTCYFIVSVEMLCCRLLHHVVHTVVCITQCLQPPTIGNFFPIAQLITQILVMEKCIHGNCAVYRSLS